MATTNVPLCFKRAREEMILALGAETAADEGEHRLLADRYMTRAVQVIDHDPDREYDWSALAG